MIWAEAGPCEGDVDYALKCAEAVAEAGATVLKVQWFTADTLVTRDAPRYDHTGGTGTQWESFQDAIPYPAWGPVVERCRELNIGFAPSVFDLDAVFVAGEMGLKLLKIASADITYHQLISEAAKVAEVIVLSTGGANQGEISLAIEAVLDGGKADIWLMACHLQYPTPLRDASLGRIKHLKSLWPTVPVGLSDHTEGIAAIPVAVGAGAVWVEKHFSLLGPGTGDRMFALDPAGLRNAVTSFDLARDMMGGMLGRDAGEEEAVKLARRSLISVRDIKSGELVSRADIAVLRPGWGMPPYELERLFWKRDTRVAAVDIAEGQPVQRDWFEPEEGETV